MSLAVQGLCIVWLRPAWQRTAWTNFAIEDSWMYRGMADMFRQHGLLYDGTDIHDAVRARTPGYPLLILAVDELAWRFGLRAAALLTLTNALLYAGACALLVRLVSAWTTEAAGLAAGLVLTLTPAVPFSLAHMPESLALVLWLASQLLLVQGLQRSALWLLALAGAAGALAALTKPVFLFAEAVSLMTILAAASTGLRRRLGYVAVHGILYLLVLAPWYARNWAVWHEFVLTPNGGTHLYRHMRPFLLAELGLPIHDPAQTLNGGYADARVPNTAEDWQRQFGSSWNNLASRNAVLSRLTMQDIAHNPLAFVRLALRRHPLLYVGTAPKSMAIMADEEAETPAFKNMSNAETRQWLWKTHWWQYQLVTWALLGATFLAAGLGTCRAWRERRYAFLQWSFLTLIYFALITGPFNHSRYRFPMMPIFAGLAGQMTRAFPRRAR